MLKIVNELVSGAAPNNNYLNIWFNNILYTMFVQLFWTPVIFDISNKFKESSELIRKTKKKKQKTTVIVEITISTWVGCTMTLYESELTR